MFRHPLLSLAYGDLVFIDTPGFDDSMPKSDADVLKMIDNWLKSMYVFISMDHPSANPTRQYFTKDSQNSMKCRKSS